MEKMKNNQYEDVHFPTSPFEATQGKASSLSAPVSPFSDHHHSPGDFPAPAPENGAALAARKPLSRRRTSFAHRIREHVRMGPNFAETVKGKLSVGAKIIKKGGRGNMFRDMFGMSDGEKLLKASQCYLSTTAGPIAGTLFISTHKVAFCSERSIPLHSSSHGVVTAPYKAGKEQQLAISSLHSS
ncbi:putative GEM-like protein 8 isoform X2 [Andrographis paniculata]|uniref:putative GEM-like protein 8 isoform X2 n=1 Tax=Andrographis paniculata TaxID=175694 RepID=UPI0021E7D2AC|nr:putative GEM-like protein 8 isoform X2 [Andrographis paniculata]